MTRRRKVLRIVWHSLLTTSLLALVGGVVALVLLLESGVLTPRILTLANGALGPATALRVDAEAIRWRPWSGLSLQKARVASIAGADSSGTPRTLFDVERLEIGYKFLGLASRHPRIDRVRLVNPNMDLAALLRWNAKRPARAANDSEGQSVGAGLRIEDFQIVDGTLVGESGLKLSGIRLGGSLDGTHEGWMLVLQDVSTTLRKGSLDEKLEGHGQIKLAKGMLEIEELALQSEGAYISVKGLLVPSESGESNLAVDGAGIALERVAAWLDTKHPLLAGNLSMHLTARGVPTSMRVEARFANDRPGRLLEEVRLEGTRSGAMLLVESMRVTIGEGRADIQGDITLEKTPRFSAYATLSGFDPFEIFAFGDSADATALDGTVQVDGHGLTRGSFVGNAEVNLTASRIRGVPIDAAKIQVAGRGGALSLRETRIMRRGTEVTGVGTIDTKNEVSARFQGTVRDLADLGGIIPALSPNVLQGEAIVVVELTGPIAGPRAAATLVFEDASILGAKAGVLEIRADMPRMAKNAEAAVELRGQEVGYKGWLVPESEASLLVRAESIEIKSFRATSSARGTIELSGDIDLSQDDVLVASITPLRLRSPDGTLSWENEGSIVFERRGEMLSVDGVDLRSGEGRVRATIERLPGGSTHAQLSGKNVALEDFTTYFRLSRRLVGDVEFDTDFVVDAHDVRGRLDLDLVNGSWGLTSLERVTARLEAKDGRVTVEEAALRTGIGEVDVSGEARTGGEGLRDLFRGAEARERFLDALVIERGVVAARAASLDSLKVRASWFPSPGGAGSFDATIHGAATRPEVEFHGEATGARLGVRPLDKLAFAGDFADGTVHLRECTLESDGGIGSIEATWPLDWSLAQPKPRLVHDRALDLKVTAERFPVGTLAAIDTLFAMGAGPFWAQATMTGSLNEPFVDGAFRVENGELMIPFFDRPLSKGVLNGRLSTKRIDIPTFEFEDGWGDGDKGGRIRGKARIDFDRLKVVDYKVDAHADEFRYRGFAGIDATGDGTLEITPTKFAPEKTVPHIVGRFVVNRADLDERILVPPAAKRQAPPGVNVPAEVDSSFAASEEAEKEKKDAPIVLMDINFVGSKNLWLRTHEIDVEFAGDITLHATPAYAGITGETHSLRGTYSLYNTKFDIERGDIEYTDPAAIGASYIDCLATTRVLDEDVEVHVSGTLENPIIESTSSSGYSEAEIYRLLALRIKRTDPSAGPATTSDFNRDLLASWGSLFASRFGRNLSREIGIDQFDVDVSEAKSKVGVGKYIGRDFFVRYNQQVGETNPATSGIEERLETPERQLLLEYRLSRILRLQGETGTIEGDGYLNLDLMAEWGY